jgi:flavodoxin short chain
VILGWKEALVKKHITCETGGKERTMEKIQVVFWSQGGNTEAMAEAIGKGITEAGKEAVVVNVANASLDDLKAAKTFALGCPAMGDEVLEEEEMEPFVCAVEGFASGKTIALFGSYGWGDGQWMRDWVDRMNRAGAAVLNEEGLMANETPNDDELAECIAVGKQLAAV